MMGTFQYPPRWATEIFDKVREYPAMLDQLSTAELQAVRDAAEHELGEVVVRDIYCVDHESGELTFPYGLHEDDREIRLDYVAFNHKELWEQEEKIYSLITQIDAKLTPERGRGRPPEYPEDIKQAAADFYRKNEDYLQDKYGLATGKKAMEEIYRHLRKNYSKDKLPKESTLRRWIGIKD